MRGRFAPRQRAIEDDLASENVRSLGEADVLKAGS
jgi:hypothetical protein